MDLKKLFVYVPAASEATFISSVINVPAEAAKYANKIVFLESSHRIWVKEKFYGTDPSDLEAIWTALGIEAGTTPSGSYTVGEQTFSYANFAQWIGALKSYADAKIAAEKAGIIKRGVSVVIGEANEETRPVFEAKAKEMNAPIVFAEDYQEVISADSLPGGGMLYHTRNNGILHGDLSGAYQVKNMNTVMCVAFHLGMIGYLSICEKPENQEKCRFEFQRAIEHVTTTTGLMGRWQIMQQNPRVVCDTGHNVGGWQYLSKQLQQQQCRQMHIIFGMVSDKDLDGVLQLLPKKAIYYFTKADNKRAINEADLQLQAAKHGLLGERYPTVREAYTQCMKNALRDDFVFVGGSSYVVGDFLKIFK
jgi:dihydrofolate synthase/folylpolyglutamate synthase